MSVHDHTTLMICPAADLAQITAIGVEMGHSDREFSIPLSPTGAEPATHYACCPATTRGYALMLTEWQALPEEPEDGVNYAPLPADTLAWLRSTLTISINPPLDPEGTHYASPLEQFEAVIGEMGLQRVVAEETP
jgi:hypothetical protein